MTELNQAYSKQKSLFSNFIMPMVLLSIRVEMEVMLKSAYPQFLGIAANEKETVRLVNGVITQLLDP